MKRLFKEKRAFKKSSFLLFIIIVISLFFGIGYAQIVGDPLEVEGTASAYEHEGVYVSGVNWPCF